MHLRMKSNIFEKTNNIINIEIYMFFFIVVRQNKKYMRLLSFCECDDDNFGEELHVLD